MRIKEIHEILQNKKNGKVTQNDIARAIGTSRANVSKLFAKNSFINDEKIKKIEDYFEIKLNNIGDIAFIDYYPEKVLEFKGNTVEFSDKHVKFKIPKVFFNMSENSEHIMCHAEDNSMYPSIKSGDFLVVKLGNNEIKNNKIHVFYYDKTFYVRRLIKNINEIIVEAENPEFGVQKILQKDIKKLYIIGIAVNIIRASDSL